MTTANEFRLTVNVLSSLPGNGKEALQPVRGVVLREEDSGQADLELEAGTGPGGGDALLGCRERLRRQLLGQTEREVVHRVVRTPTARSLVAWPRRP